MDNDKGATYRIIVYALKDMAVVDRVLWNIGESEPISNHIYTVYLLIVLDYPIH